MVRKFRPEFEEVIADAGRRWTMRATSPRCRAGRDPGGVGMSEPREVTLTIDGREIAAIEGEMLHDAARKGDVEIPVFCYEPKLGEPVGACRMCLVEIEGIPKLQTSCSTPVRDGHGRPHPHRAGQARAERGGRVPARQPPARLPRLRQRRRVPAAGHHAGLGPGQKPGDRRKAPLREADRTLAAGRDRPRALHPLLPLRALQPGGLRGRRSCSCSSAATAPSSAPSTTAPTSPPSTATSPSSARSAR